MSVLTELTSVLFLQSKSKVCVAPERPAAEPQKQEVQGVFAQFCCGQVTRSGADRHC